MKEASARMPYEEGLIEGIVTSYNAGVIEPILFAGLYEGGLMGRPH